MSPKLTRELGFIDVQSGQAHQGVVYKGQTVWGKGSGDACNLLMWDMGFLWIFHTCEIDEVHVISKTMLSKTKKGGCHNSC